ncbi:RNA methyltransferase, partial [Nitratidesulfovibrio liaohensis]|uniref:RNA methyltransferase n=1 Tax=Nitratidesulfovibrio liaohensis TaxID=2604158 RepID=UPI00142396B0
MLHNLTVVLVKTRFPENVGMVARACANMGARDIVLVDPERWSEANGDPAKAVPLATPKGQDILSGVRVVGTLAEAVAGCAVVFGTT